MVVGLIPVLIIVPTLFLIVFSSLIFGAGNSNNGDR